MIFSLLADLTMVVHLAFIIFVVLGGGLIFRWPWVIWLHVPSALWGALIQLVGWVCPLTPLENRFLQLAGESGYTGDFIGHYLIPIIYPDNLTHAHHMLLGGVVVGVNAIVYGLLLWIWVSRRRNR